VISLKPANGYVGNPTDIAWKTSGYAVWQAGYQNKYYTIYLYKNGSSIGSYTSKEAKYDFRKVIANNGAGIYTYKVRGETTNNTSNSNYYVSEYVESYEFYVTDADVEQFKTSTTATVDGNGPGGSSSNTTPDGEQPVDPQGHRMSEAQRNNTLGEPGTSGLVKGWIRDQVGWWYRNSDLTWTKDNWQKIDDKWYHFDEMGYMQSGWLDLTTAWYKLADSGEMQTGWVLDNGHWYYMNPENGKMQTGYIKVDNKFYYMSEKTDETHPLGAMYENEVCPDGRYASETGALGSSVQ
jgi:glucan-binding YG repeat protein